ncbi:hypothetical protein GCM10027160_54640 [Streptomyces calidiresistens]|uniref:Uncharacterized protein n=1 Tax=Streptomyces calidiresistens TaxID=1485586 RepID=A0A7W3XYR3_9ACTN|nr:hypothetical protein [Streptomyces calidiresistens]MBB0232415.1 hypothetical protein [Streptomyces calidiresistens]
MPLWFLLYERHEDGLLRAELSLPVRMSGKYVTQWQVRIPIDLPDSDPGTSIDLDRPSSDGGPDVLVEFLQA